MTWVRVGESAVSRQTKRLDKNAQWLHVAAALGSLCNRWANRRDLTVYLGDDGGQGVAPAFFDSALAEIEINSISAFGQTDPADVGDLRDRMELSQYPVAGGMALHEAMHARFSRSDWNILRNEFDDRSWMVYTLLEEMRVESRGAALFPQDAPYLRASAREVIMGGSDGVQKATSSPRFAAQVIYGRWVAGVLEPMDVAPVRSWLLSNGWSSDVLDSVEEVTKRFALLEDEGMQLVQQVELAKELDSIMPVDPTSGTEGLSQAISEALGRAERGGREGVFEAADRIEAEKDAEQARQEQATNKSKSNSVFRNLDGSDRAVPMELAGSRPPTSEEQSGAIALARALELARYRDRAMVEFGSEIPPGRLHGGEAMRLAAAKWAGAPTSGYKPFKSRKRLVTEEPKLTVGVMCDTSGSMQSVQPAVGSAVWVISEAIHRIDKAQAAQVYFGKDVKPGLQKGERLSAVRTWKGGGAYEDFDGAFRALDGELNLLQGSGARLLVVISDGEFKRGPSVNQVKASQKWTDSCINNGVAVVWLQIRGQNYLSENSRVEVVDVDASDITSATHEIGQACIRSLAEVSGVDSGGW